MNQANKPPELFVSERPIRSEFARRRHGPSYAVRRFITVFILCALIGAGLYFALHHKSAPTVPGEIPTIKAEGNYKSRPEQPGGIDIPHQDVQVYQEIDGKNDKAPAVEHLLPPPEQPQTANLIAPKVAGASANVTEKTESLIVSERQQSDGVPLPLREAWNRDSASGVDATPRGEGGLGNPDIGNSGTPPLLTSPSRGEEQSSPNGKSASIQSVPPIDVAPKPTPMTTATQTKPVASTAAPEQASIPAAAPPVAKQQAESLDAVFQKVAVQDPQNSAPASAPAPAVLASVAPTIKAPAAIPPAAGKGVAIQLASMPDHDAAQANLSKLQKQYAAQLGGASLHLVKADLGAKGIYYRIQSDNLPEARAKSICTAIKAKNGGCILAKP